MFLIIDIPNPALGTKKHKWIHLESGRASWLHDIGSILVYHGLNIWNSNQPWLKIAFTLSCSPRQFLGIPYVFKTNRCQDSGCRQFEHILLGIQHRHCCWCPGGHYGGTGVKSKDSRTLLGTSGMSRVNTAGVFYDHSYPKRHLHLFHRIWPTTSKSPVSVVSNSKKTQPWSICCGACLWNLKIGWLRTSKSNESNAKLRHLLHIWNMLYPD